MSKPTSGKIARVLGVIYPLDLTVGAVGRYLNEATANRM